MSHCRSRRSRFPCDACHSVRRLLSLLVSATGSGPPRISSARTLQSRQRYLSQRNGSRIRPVDSANCLPARQAPLHLTPTSSLSLSDASAPPPLQSSTHLAVPRAHKPPRRRLQRGWRHRRRGRRKPVCATEAVETQFLPSQQPRLSPLPPLLRRRHSRHRQRAGSHLAEAPHAMSRCRRRPRGT